MPDSQMRSPRFPGWGSCLRGQSRRRSWSKGILGAALLVPVLSPSLSSARDGWWDRDWKLRRSISLFNPGQQEDLHDFPVAVLLSSQRFSYQRVQPRGRDLRFVDADQKTLLRHEVEKWDPSGQSLLWIKVPRLPAGSRPVQLWMYYGNSRPLELEAGVGVWEDGFQAVWHLGDAASETPFHIRDSSGQGNHGLTRGSLGGQSVVPGKVGDGLRFNGSDDYVEHPHHPSLALDRLTPFTLEAWIRTGQRLNQSILAKQSLQMRGYHLLLDNRPDPALPFTLRLVMPHIPAQNEIKVIGSQELTDGRWHYVGATYDGSGKAEGVRLYVDGVPEKSEIVYNSLLDTMAAEFPFYIANRGRGDMKFQGDLDEIRVSGRVRRPAWFQAQYRSMTDALITLGKEEVHQ